MKILKNKILKRSFIIGIPFILISLITWKAQTMVCKGLEIRFLNNKNKNFVDESDIRAMLKKTTPNILGYKMKQIDVEYLEKIINKNPAIKQADVYKSINGKINVDVTLRSPILKIYNSHEQSYYIDEEGNIIPDKGRFYEQILIANGNINYKYSGKLVNVFKDSLQKTFLDELILMTKLIKSDNFLDAQIQQLYVNKKNEFELIPRVGPHIVLFGKIDNYEKKFRNLKYFYLNVLNGEGWNKYSEINLKYDKQIVCTKR